MRKVFGGALVAMMLTCVGTGNAVVFTDVYDPYPGVYLDKHHDTVYSFTHDITDSGFQPSAYTVTSADIYLTFHDDKDNILGIPDIFDLIHEKVSFTFDSVYQDQKEIDTDMVHFLVDTQLLQSDGKVQVTLKAIEGDVYFDKSTLKAQATLNAHETPTPTPEPASLLLLGSGLVGLAFKGRKKLRLMREKAL